MPPGAQPGRDALWIAAAFALVALALAHALPFVDDEGELTWQCALTLSREPVATLFFQKFHPPLALFYAPLAPLGWRAFVTAHVAVAALGVALLGRLGVALGGSAAVAAGTVALSPVYLAAAVSGHSNSDGIALLALALWLRFGDRPRPLAAGAALGAALWVRFEAAPILLGLGALALLRRDLRVPLGGALVALPYALLGALYHRDPLWVLHFPPDTPALLPRAESLRAYIRPDASFVVYVLLSLALVAPAWPLGLTLRWRSLPAAAREVLGLHGLTAALMFALPVAGLFNFEHHPRYFLVLLPGLALAAALAVRAPPTASTAARATASTAALMATLLAGGHVPGAVLAALPLGAPWLLWGPGRSWRAGLALAPVAAVLLAVGARRTPLLDIIQMLPTAELHAVARGLPAASSRPPGAVVYTTSHQLGLYLPRGLHDPRAVRYIPGDDIPQGLSLLLNPHNGQYARVVGALSGLLYGGAAWACSFAARPLHAGDLVVLEMDGRGEALYLPETWRPVAQERSRAGRYIVLDVVRDGALPAVRSGYPPGSAWDRAWRAPCEVGPVSAGAAGGGSPARR